MATCSLVCTVLRTVGSTNALTDVVQPITADAQSRLMVEPVACCCCISNKQSVLWRHRGLSPGKLVVLQHTGGVCTGRYKLLQLLDEGEAAIMDLTGCQSISGIGDCTAVVSTAATAAEQCYSSIHRSRTVVIEVEHTDSLKEPGGAMGDYTPYRTVGQFITCWSTRQRRVPRQQPRMKEGDIPWTSDESFALFCAPQVTCTAS